jgi:hypothetical protein
MLNQIILLHARLRQLLEICLGGLLSMLLKTTTSVQTKSRVQPHLQCIFAVPEHDQVMPNQVVLLQARLRQLLELRLCSLSVVQPEMVTRFQVDRQGALRVGLEVHLQDLEADVIVVQLAVAERDVDVQGEELPARIKTSADSTHALGADVTEVILS